MPQRTGKTDWKEVFSNGTDPPDQAGTREEVWNNKKANTRMVEWSQEALELCIALWLAAQATRVPFPPSAKATCMLQMVFLPLSGLFWWNTTERKRKKEKRKNAQHPMGYKPMIS